MKKTIIILSAIFMMSFAETKVSYKSADIDGIQQKLSIIYNYIDNSNLPHKDVLQIQQTLREIGITLSKGDTSKIK